MLSDGDILEAVGRLIVEVANDTVRPLFRNLRAEDIRLKAEDDYVTAADLACEAALAERLAALLPGVPLMGEEGVHSGTASLDAGAARFFLCDPIDGTRHFKNGSERYSVMLALIEGGQTTHGWIYAPEHGLMADAARGLGARLNGRAVRLSERPLAAGDALSVFGEFGGERLKARVDRLIPGIRHVNGYGVGMDYMDVLLERSRGVFQCVANAWDVMPGQFIMAQAGLATGRFDSDAANPLAAQQWTYALPSAADVALLVPGRAA